MNKIIKRLVSYLLLLMLIITNYWLIINISSRTLISDKTLEKELQQISVTDVINSNIFDNNSDMVKIRKNIQSIYSLADILDIPDEKVTDIINSKISKDIIIKIMINVKESIITGKDYVLFQIDDFNYIVDNNIDLIIKDIDLELTYPEKLLLKKILKEVGQKIFNDVPSTKTILDKIDNNQLVIIKLVISDKLKNILLIIDIILLLLLIILNINKYLFKYIFIGLLTLTILLLITSIIISNSIQLFDNEWIFIRKFVLLFKNNIIIKLKYCLTLTGIIFIINIIIKRRA